MGHKGMISSELDSTQTEPSMKSTTRTGLVIALIGVLASFAAGTALSASPLNGVATDLNVLLSDSTDASHRQRAGGRPAE